MVGRAATADVEVVLSNCAVALIGRLSAGKGAISSWNGASMAATAAGAAAVEIVLAGRPAQFKSLCHILADRFLHLLHRLLSVQKIARDRVVDQCVAVLLKITDFLGT